MKSTIAIAVVAVLLLVLLSSAYTVDIREQVIITQFGKPVGDPVVDPGLHFRTPFIQTVNRLDKRWLEWDGEVDEMRTTEKTPILVDSYARWRISDPLKFFLRLRDERTAQTRLDDIIGSETRNVLAANNLIEIVRSTDRELPDLIEISGPNDAAKPEPGPDEPKADPEQAAAPNVAAAAAIEKGREKLTRMILAKVSATVPDYGIEVVDLRFQRVNYTPQVEQKAFERMISERKRIAARYRSEGQGESARIQGRVTEDLKKIESEAYRKVQEIKGSADARATTIYAAAHSLDPELYRLLKSLDSYETTIDKDTWVILSTDADYFKALKSMR